MGSERRSRQKTTRVAGCRATFRGKVVGRYPPKTGATRRRVVYRAVHETGESPILLTPGHSTDSISVVLEDGDSYIGDAAAKFLRFAGTKYCIIYIEDLDQYYASWRQLIQSGATRLNPAHGKPFGIEKLAKYIGRNRARNMVQVP